MTKDLAIRILKGDTIGTYEQVDEAVRMAIEALAQPTQTNVSNTLNALDCISRQAAIDAVLDRMDVEKHGRDAKPEEIQWTLEKLPSTQPEGIKYIKLSEEDYEKMAELMRKTPLILTSAQSDRKVGKWIDHSDNGYVECPFCGSATNCDDNINELHYCFSCGAKMED